MPGTTTDLRALAEQAASQYHRLVLVVGEMAAGKTAALTSLAAETGWPVVSVSATVSAQLLELTRKERQLRLAGILVDTISATGSDVVLIDNIELLFDPSLASDPLRLLQGASRNRTLIVAWPGSCDDKYLTHADPDHPERWRQPRPNVPIVTLGTASAPAASDREGQPA